METKTIKCDHCGKEIKEHEYGTLSIDRVMLKDWHNETDSRPTYSGEYELASLDLCPDCAITFLAFSNCLYGLRKSLITMPQRRINRNNFKIYF